MRHSILLYYILLKSKKKREREEKSQIRKSYAARRAFKYNNFTIYTRKKIILIKIELPESNNF